MTVVIGHASINELGKSYGGQKGDQNSKEVYTKNWYDGNWTTVLRHKDPAVAIKIANAAKAICRNEKVGYSSDVAERNTLYDESSQVDFDFDKIARPCSADCSSFVHVCCIAAGVKIFYGVNAMTTRTMMNRLIGTGEFTQHTSSQYTKSDKLLHAGDILHKVGHTAIVTESYNATIVVVELPVLKLGDTGDVVEVAQRILSTYGYHLGNNNPYDGKFGKLTQAAVTEYQSDNSLRVTGIIDATTWHCLILGRKER